MEFRLKSLFGGVVLAVAVASGGTNDLIRASTNDLSSVDVKAPEFTSFNWIYSNNVQYAEMKGRIYTGDKKKYSLQSCTNLVVKDWQTISSKDLFDGGKKEEFCFQDLVNGERKFYRINKE